MTNSGKYLNSKMARPWLSPKLTCYALNLKLPFKIRILDAFCLIFCPSF